MTSPTPLLQIVTVLRKIFIKVWKVKFSNIQLFATLLHSLNRYHTAFTVSIVDEVMEEIRIGLEVGGRSPIAFPPQNSMTDKAMAAKQLQA